MLQLNQEAANNDRPVLDEPRKWHRGLNSLLDVLENQFTTWPVLHEAAIPVAPAGATPSATTSAPVPQTEPDQEIDDVGIEGALIRGLARSPQPRRS
jgi:hypothetical protein